ncbi:MAG: sulfatase-like hydrolase/transferase [Candidatus Micrarchaeota archaeon]|nr:sulfatase-like hydrolase/transferase [Candidatus Micrarchaeota archaeon]
MDTARASTFEEHMRAKSVRLAKRNDFVYIKECIAPASWTLPSHASIFTGLYPKQHGAHETKSIKGLNIDQIRLRLGTFLSDLKQIGYTTYGISANPYIHPIYGFDEFDHFREESYFTDMHGRVLEISNELKPKVSKYRNMVIGENDSNLAVIMKLVRKIGVDDPALLMNMIASGIVLTPIAALKKFKAKYIEGWPVEKGGSNIVNEIRNTKFGKHFFLFVNLMEAHEPYIGKKELDFSWATPFLKEKIDRAALEKGKRIYNYAVKKAADYAYEIAEEAIKKGGENTVVIITSDHGQEFGEHGFVGHGSVLHDEVVKVPLVIMAPKGISRKLGKGVASLTNVRKFISSLIEEEKEPLAALYSKSAYSESFGVPANLRNVKGIDLKKLESYERYSKRSFR